MIGFELFYIILEIMPAFIILRAIKFNNNTLPEKRGSDENSSEYNVKASDKSVNELEESFFDSK